MCATTARASSSVAVRAAAGCVVVVVSPGFAWSGAAADACACGGVGVVVVAPSFGCDGPAQSAKSATTIVSTAQDNLANDPRPQPFKFFGTVTSLLTIGPL